MNFALLLTIFVHLPATAGGFVTFSTVKVQCHQLVMLLPERGSLSSFVVFCFLYVSFYIESPSFASNTSSLESNFSRVVYLIEVINR